MRLAVGDFVLLTDGRGIEAKAELLNASKDGAELEIHSVRNADQRPFRLELFQGILKGARMDWLIEKATELGVDAIHPVVTQYSVAGEKADRWSRLAQAALKQSGNLIMPAISEALPFSEALARLETNFQGFLLSPEADLGLGMAMQTTTRGGAGRIVLAIGPEGGFSDQEEKLLEKSGFRPCRLSGQILRGETAALAALSISLHALEFRAQGAL